MIILKVKSQRPKIGAAATLPVILLIGGLVVEIGIAGAFIAYFLSQSGFGIKLSEEALAAARAGIQDATMRIIRSKSSVPNSYTLTIGNRSAQITICKDKKTVSSACDTEMTGKYEITSLGAALTKRRQIRTILRVDSYTGEVKLESEREIAI
jgi:hypothetical protein